MCCTFLVIEQLVPKHHDSLVAWQRARCCGGGDSSIAREDKAARGSMCGEAGSAATVVGDETDGTGHGSNGWCTRGGGFGGRNPQTGGARVERPRSTAGPQWSPRPTWQRHRGREPGQVRLTSRIGLGFLPGPAHKEEKEFLLPKAFFIPHRNENNSGKKYLGTSENYENFLEGIFEYLEQLLH
jgi:hypothetical protein